MERIANSSEVVAHFGYWPEFADAPIERFTFQDRGAISFALRYIDSGTRKSGLVTLSFGEVSDVQLTDLLTHNYLDALEIGEGPENLVRLVACSGLAGSFRCKSISVVAFEV
jgi:hypothetical protein